MLKNTEIGTLKYSPWFLTISVHLQGIVFCLREIWFKTFKNYKYRREILELADGGEIAIDWLVHPNDGEIDFER